MCIDYRVLNQVTIKDRYHIPLINKLFKELCGAMVFLKIYFRSEH